MACADEFKKQLFDRGVVRELLKLLEFNAWNNEQWQIDGYTLLYNLTEHVLADGSVNPFQEALFSEGVAEFFLRMGDLDNELSYLRAAGLASLAMNGVSIFSLF